MVDPGQGRIRLIDAPDVADEATNELARATCVAVDTEFHAERRYRPELLLVQVHVPGGDTFLIDPLATGIVARVASALREVPTWIVHAGFHDLRLLRSALGGLPARVWDTQLAAGLVDDAYPAGFEALCGTWLGLAVDKRTRMSDWTRRPLSPEQQGYAAADVQWLPGLLASLRAEVERHGRVSQFEAACDEALASAHEDDPVPSALRRAVAGADLSIDELGVLRELVAWRERAAASQDRPPHYLIGDAMLRELARARPHDRVGLEGNRRLSERTLQHHGRGLLEAIARGADVDPALLPAVVRRHTPEARRAALLDVVAIALGHQQRFAAALVLPRDRCDALALLPTPDRGAIARILGAWRDELVGDVVTAALAGEIGLSAAGGDMILTPLSPILRKTESG